MEIYAWPRIGRAGLGNSLLPWARAELFAARTGARILEPDWTSVRLGPYLRREADKRNYGGYFYTDAHVRGLAKLFVRAVARRVDENELNGNEYAGRRPLLVRFSGLGSFFTPLLGHAAFIRDRLWQMTRENLRPRSARRDHRFVAMHVRRGDITRQGFTSRELAQVTQYTPLSWFVGMARAVRNCLSTRALPIVVYTDGFPDEVADLTKLPGVQLSPREEAIAALWAMSQASLLFGSGYSTFSMWSSYLGGMPTLYAPGKLAQRILGEREGGVELELAAGNAIPEAVVKAIDSRPR